MREPPRRTIWKGDSGPYIFVSYDGKTAFPDLSCHRPGGGCQAHRRFLRDPAYVDEPILAELGQEDEATRLVDGFRMLGMS